jgi:hypothetical protein
MKIYRGTRSDDGCSVTVDERPLNPRYDLRNHSPAGFEWGYGGSGPAQLALALLADHLGDDEQALDVYQQFKFSIVGKLPTEWTLTSEEVRDALKSLAEREAGRSHQGARA